MGESRMTYATTGATPGPWTWTTGHSGCWRLVGGSTVVLTLQRDGRGVQADRRLIAAAPLLADALRGMMDAAVQAGMVVREGGLLTPLQDAYLAARAAIAAAEGKEAP